MSNHPLNGSLPLHQHVQHSLTSYFDQLGEEQPNDLYRMVLDEVERPLLNIVLQQTNGNLSRAAAMLGLNRSTLRKKLLAHNLAD